MGLPPPEGSRIRVQIRYRAPDVSALALSVGESMVLAFDEPQHAVTPGQSAVFFDEERVLGGGRIARAMSGVELEVGTLTA